MKSSPCFVRGCSQVDSLGPFGESIKHGEQFEKPTAIHQELLQSYCRADKLSSHRLHPGSTRPRSSESR